ncbi:acyltransferase family protein [Hymenobacter rubripertinctus]|uniref:Acyltransferase n=1 Tax=Hymenobacter rubripertinctus TaxID=2029981 RepID=A0A418QND5_9BACT|nr:acyltransferase [Hymenobacter rubripertinctus]RIY06669.1 acyltransferase [Hymenobacter rubripertinctus]
MATSSSQRLGQPAAGTFAGPTEPPYLPVLTGVRAVAAYLVYLHHFNPFRQVAGLEGRGWEMVREFHVGVPIFFVLSGFLIAFRYAEAGPWTRAWWGRYLRNRVARIYPLYFLLTALTFAGLWYQTRVFSLKIWLLNVTFLRGFFEEYVYSGLSQGWTLTVEECFYLAAPLMFGALRRRPGQVWRLPGLLLAGGVALVGLGRLLAFHGLFGNLKFMLLFTFFGRATEFFVGIGLARWLQRHPPTLGPVGWRTVTGAFGMAAVVVVLARLRGPYAYGQEHPVGIVLNNVVLPVGIALWFTGLLTERTLLRQVLSSRPLQVLGKSSYAFYLIHAGIVQEFVARLLPGQPLLVFLVLLGIAIGLHYALEEPLNRWLRAARRLPAAEAPRPPRT